MSDLQTYILYTFGCSLVSLQVAVVDCNVLNGQLYVCSLESHCDAALGSKVNVDLYSALSSEPHL